MNNKTTQIIIALVLVAGSFYAGTKYGSSTASASTNGIRMGNFPAGAGRGNRIAGGNGFITGNIISKDPNGITVQMRDGGSKIILITPSTQVMKSTSGSVSDLVIGKEISGNGTTNSDGSITASAIQIRPASTTGMMRTN